MAKQPSKSIEEKVEDYYKGKLDVLGIKRYGKTEDINSSIKKALKDASSKSGGSGSNYPDIQLLLDDNHSRFIPVMIEAKGAKGKLDKEKNGKILQYTCYESDSKDKDGNIKHHAGEKNWTAVQNYAVNGALHYGLAILENSDYKECIIIGVNGSEVDSNGKKV